MKIAATAAIYFALARLSFLAVLPFSPEGPSLIWLPTGFALFALLTGGPSLALGIALGSALNGVLLGLEPWAVVCFVAANTFDPVIEALVLRRILKRDLDLRRTRDAMLFASVTIFLASPLSAGIGVATLAASQGLTGGALRSWMIWWVSDFLGVLVVTPFLLAVRKWPRAPAGRTKRLERLAGVGITAILLHLILSGWLLGGDSLHFVYWLFPTLIWLAFREDGPGITLGVLVLAFITIAATAMGFGPFIGDSTDRSFVYVQSFLAVFSLVGLILNAAVHERDQAIRERDEFFLLASHELNTPLMALDLQAQVLKGLIESSEFDALSLDRRIKLVEIHTTAVKRLTNLVQGLLESARVVTGKFTIHPLACDLRRLVEEVLREDSQAFGKAASLIHFAPGAAVAGFWDPAKLRLLVRCLLDNALKYSGGKPVHISVESSGAAARIEVRDQGIGIPERDREKLFQRFGRAARLDSFGGLGQSLFIGKAIVDAHGGRIRVESRAGEGTRFLVDLPLRAVAHPASPLGEGLGTPLIAGGPAEPA